MSSRRIMVIDHPTTKLSAMLEALERFSGHEGPYTLIVGGDVPTDRIEIPDAWIGDNVIVEYKLHRIDRAPTPVFTGPRRSKGERKRNKANRWS